MHEDPGLLRKAFRAGASGYVLKRSPVGELSAAVREVLAGHSYVSPSMSEVLEIPLTAFVGGRDARRENLTPRQQEVLTLVAEGKSLKEIAAILDISVKGAEFHKYRIMKKLGLRTTAELTCYAVKHGLVSLE
jgi:DNA-binding NarL/FixJ family response regulator